MKIQPNPYLKSLTCLYVEDDDSVRESFLLILNKLFDKVYVAKDGKEGLELYKKYRPDIILSDIKMPNMDGLEMSKELKQLDSSAYIVLLSAFTDTEFLKEALDLGIEGYITKPIDKKKLYQKLNFLAEIIKNKKDAQENLSLLKKFFEELNDAVILTKTNYIKLKNSAFVNEFGNFEDLEEFKREFEIEDLNHSKPLITNIKMDNTQKTYEISCKKVDHNHNIITFKNISELNKKIYTDELTNAYNRKYLNSIIPELLNKKACFILIDIDDFKKINDTYGHLSGDIVLQIIAEVVKDHLRKQDYFIRWGGEEFLIIPKSVDDYDTAYKIAENLRKEIEKSNFMDVERVTCSFGVSCGEINTPDDVKEIFKKADKALYRAKRNGKNRVEVEK